jgi:hypothetical protein
MNSTSRTHNKTLLKNFFLNLDIGFRSISKSIVHWTLNHHCNCHNPSLGLTTKARACKVVGQEGGPGVWESMRMDIQTPKWAPFWELESRWALEFLERNCKGQNPSHWRVFYIIENLLKLRCLKWAHMTYLDIWNTCYSQKKGRESNWQFDSRPLRVENRSDFLVCKWRVTYCWKDLEESYNFALGLILIKGLHTKLSGPKVAGVPTLAISRLPFGKPMTKSHLDVGLVNRQNILEGGRWWIPPSPSCGESCESEFTRDSS